MRCVFRFVRTVGVRSNGTIGDGRPVTRVAFDGTTRCHRWNSTNPDAVDEPQSLAPNRHWTSWLESFKCMRAQRRPSHSRRNGLSTRRRPSVMRIMRPSKSGVLTSVVNRASRTVHSLLAWPIDECSTIVHRRRHHAAFRPHHRLQRHRIGLDSSAALMNACRPMRIAQRTNSGGRHHNDSA
jgi:hypothetical protein